MASNQDEPRPVPKLLIADDDPGIARLLATRCAKLGFEVHTASNGVQALVMANHIRPDVVILDINMPQIDGLSVAARLLRPDSWPLEIIVITSSAYAETAARCESFGAFYVRKGLDLWSGVRSTLALLFPHIDGEDVPNGRPGPSPAEIRMRPRVLIVDADPALGTLLSSRLGKLGIDPVLAGDAVQGYRYALSEDPSVIISSYRLPNGDVQYLMQKLRSTPSTAKIPVFVFSDEPIDEMARSRLARDGFGKHQSAVHFFSKPVDLGALFAALQDYCAFAINPSPLEARA